MLAGLFRLRELLLQRYQRLLPRVERVLQVLRRQIAQTSREREVAAALAAGSLRNRRRLEHGARPRGVLLVALERVVPRLPQPVELLARQLERLRRRRRHGHLQRVGDADLLHHQSLG